MWIETDKETILWTKQNEDIVKYHLWQNYPGETLLTVKDEYLRVIEIIKLQDLFNKPIK
jgi:hypothetical protein